MLSVYIDNSGSMSEMGKLDVAKYIANCLNATFYTLNGEKIKDLQDLKIENTNEIRIHKEDNKKILISDGLLQKNTESSFDVALAVGLDSNVSALKKIAGRVYSINEILAFLSYIDELRNKDNDEWS